MKTNLRTYRCHLRKMLVFFALLCVETISKAQTSIVTIGATAGTGNWFYGPIMRNTGNVGTLNYSRHAYIYTAADLGIPTGSKIVKIEYLKKDGSFITGSNNFNIWLTNTTAIALPTTETWGNLSVSATQVFSSTSFTIPSGTNQWISAPLSDTFTYNGQSLQILTDWAKLGTVIGSTGVNFYVAAAAGKSIGIASQNPLTSTAVLQTATYGGSRPTMRITYIPVPACSGTPTIDSITSTTAQPCPGNVFTLTAANTIAGSGLSFLWERADDIAFSNNLTAMGSAQTLTTSQTTAYYYRCTATCNASSLTDSKTLYVPMNPFYQCYCSSNAFSDADEDIYKVTFSTLTNTSTCQTTAPGAGSIPGEYSNYTYLTPPNVEKLSVVPVSVQVGSCINNYPNNVSIWIDYDHSSTFDSGELVYASPNPTTGPHTEYTNITIPSTALTGITGMRIIVFEGNSALTNPCGLYIFGETEDYLINITPTTNCSGAPTPGNTLASTNPVCLGSTTDVSLQNLTTGQGVTYQWYGPAGVISGATNPIYNATITTAGAFYCAVTCSNSGLTTNSNPISITIDNFLNCYCISRAGDVSDDEILSVTVNGTTRTSDCSTPATGTGSLINRYSNFSPLGNLTSIALGSNVSFSMNIDNCPTPGIGPFFACAVAIWIDFNHSGTFDAGEKVFVENTGLIPPRTVTGTITIPCTALPGQTMMRIVEAEGLSGSQIIPCLQYGYGETEDHLINLTGVSCTMSITVKAFIEGYMNGLGTMVPTLMNQGVGSDPTVTDSITVELRNAAAPYALIASKKTPLSTTGIANPSFPGTPAGNYYIVIKHRNAVETWSANPVAVSNGINYDFSTNANKAYGNNQNLAYGTFVLYSGDLNYDQNVDLGDISPLETDINNFESGYRATDMNGDGNVDLGDIPLLETNIANFIYSNHP